MPTQHAATPALRSKIRWEPAVLWSFSIVWEYATELPFVASMLNRVEYAVLLKGGHEQ